ncbi:hypothetical protein KC361_g123 [Hortaea werneckii]|nr:hypothetical protein KC361_g123 [Hortaea werneckii]
MKQNIVYRTKDSLSRKAGVGGCLRSFGRSTIDQQKQGPEQDVHANDIDAAHCPPCVSDACSKNRHEQQDILTS